MTSDAIGIVDCDVHTRVPSFQDLEPYLPDHWQAYLRDNGFTYLLGPEFTYPSWSPWAIPRALSLDDVRAGVLERADTAILHVYYGLESQTHPYLVKDLATAVNSWLRAEWLDRDERLLGSIAVTPQYADSAVAEIERVGDDPRFVQVLLPARAWEPYGNHRYWPMYEAAAARGLAIGISYGGSVGVAPTAVGWVHSLFEEYGTAAQAFALHVAGLVMSGVFERHPELTVVLYESGLTWLPPAMWRLDQHWKAARREVPWVKEPPSAYVRRHVRLATNPLDLPPDPRHLERFLEQLGSDEMLVYGSDFPRVHEQAPLAAFGTALGDAQREAVLRRNAERCYRLPRPSTSAVS